MHEFYEVLLILYHFITTEDKGLAISGVFSLVTVQSFIAFRWNSTFRS